MAGRRSKLTLEVQHEIVTFIANGAYDQVAALAAGISRSTYYRWYNAGANPKSRYAAFREAVDGARGRARAVAETRVFREKPDVWLKNGPGRERPGQPGWTTLARPWADEFGSEEIEEAARRVADRQGVNKDELLDLAKLMGKSLDKLRHAASDPDLFLK